LHGTNLSWCLLFALHLKHFSSISELLYRGCHFLILRIDLLLLNSIILGCWIFCMLTISELLKICSWSTIYSITWTFLRYQYVSFFDISRALTNLHLQLLDFLSIWRHPVASLPPGITSARLLLHTTFLVSLKLINKLGRAALYLQLLILARLQSFECVYLSVLLLVLVNQLKAFITILSMCVWFVWVKYPTCSCWYSFGSAFAWLLLLFLNSSMWWILVHKFIDINLIRARPGRMDSSFEELLDRQGIRFSLD